MRAVLPDDVRARLEEFFGEDLGQVRLHAGRTVGAALSIVRVNGIVFGRRIFLSPGASSLCSGEAEHAARFLAHEICHVLQYRRMGFWKFLAAYLWGYGRHGFAYARIPLEIEAFETERRFRQACAGPPDVRPPRPD